MAYLGGLPLTTIPAAVPPLYVPPAFPAYGVPPAVEVMSDVSSSVRMEEDFTFFRYSRAKYPLLILILAIFTTLILLTMWQARSDISGLRAGIPRDLEKINSDREGGVLRYKRNIRFAATTSAIVLSLLALLVFIAPFKPAARNGINYLLAFLLFLTGVLSIICFAFDMNAERDAKRCTQNISRSSDDIQRCLLYNVGCNITTDYGEQCEMREDIATGVTFFDAALATFCILAAICLVAFSRSGDWSRARDPKLIAFGQGPGQLQPGMYPNGVSFVRKWVTLLVLLGTIAFAILLLVFTILIHEDRDRVLQKDEFGRTVRPDGTISRPGWPFRNTKLRYATCSLVIITILINLIPITSRVAAYIFAFLYFCYSVLAFVTFAVDIDAIEAAKKLLCPTGLKCVFHPYNTCAVLDFIGGFLLLVYIIVEYFVTKRPKKATPVV
jgi:hypothetical protein